MKLSNVATISAGHPFRGKIPEKQDAGIRAVQMKDVSVDEGILWSGLIETELAGKKQPDWLCKGDVLFAARGSRNYAVLISENQPNIVAAPQFYILRVKEDSLLPDFLVWQLNQKPLQNYFERSAEGTLTKSVRRSVLADACITIPPLEEQKKILNLYNTVRQERQVCAQLVENGQKLMNSIASQLITGKTV